MTAAAMQRQEHRMDGGPAWEWLLNRMEVAAVHDRIFSMAAALFEQNGRDPMKAIYPDSPDLRQLSRLVYEDPVCLVQLAATRLANRLGGEWGLLGHELFFLRWSFPGQTYDGHGPLRSWIHSPGHTDKYAAGHTASCWIPLQDITQETGGYWWVPPGSEAEAWWLAQDPNVLRVPAHYHKAVAERGADPFPPVLRNLVRLERPPAGVALVFNQSLVHGSTQALGASRLTYDFRLVRR